MIELIPSDIDIKELQDAWDKVSKEYKNIINKVDNNLPIELQVKEALKVLLK